MQKTDAQVVIIGGGIAGCATAYNLARRGVHALLLERTTFGFEASGRNAGGVRAQCRDTSTDRLLAMRSIELWQTLHQTLETEVEYVQGGTIRLAANEERLADLQAQSEEELADGLQVEMWNPEQLYRHSPFLAAGFIGAKYCATDGVANPKLVAPAFAATAARLGARTWEHTEVDAVLTEGGKVVGVQAHNKEGEWTIETPLVVHAAGPWTPQLSSNLDITIPMRPSRTIIARTEPTRPMFTEFISSHDAGVFARPDKRGSIHIGAVGRSLSDFDEVTDADIHAYVEQRVNLIPALGEVDIAEVWSGTLAMTPDSQPVMGRVDGLEGYILAAGFSGHGFCLGPAVGQQVSELILDGESSLNLDAFALSRFEEHTEFTTDSRQGTG
ncbi:MAG: FAD-binding oxidoreductase [Chloroflexota bacterium]